MNYPKTQIAWVKQCLRERGQISRNDCINMPVIDSNGLKRITRLGALIKDLRKDGWSIDRDWKGGGSDCIYKLKSAKKYKKF